PSNTYVTRDGKYIVIGANADSIFKRMMNAIGRADLASDPGLERNDGRVARTEEIERVIGDWAAAHDLDEALATLERADVPSGKIYDISDIAKDAHYAARGMIGEFRLPDGKPVQLPGIVPKMSETPGETRWLGPQLGAHTAEILGGLGYTSEQQDDLKRPGVIWAVRGEPCAARWTRSNAREADSGLQAPADFRALLSARVSSRPVIRLPAAGVAAIVC